MLVLSRKQNQSLIINDEIEVMVTRIKGGKVRLGINAPKNVIVYRNELYEKIQREKKARSSDPTRSRKEGGRGTHIT